VFIATSQKMDIVDSFEKRIKSRFSHRQILFYESSIDKFKTILENVFNKIKMEIPMNDLIVANKLYKLAFSEETFETLEFNFDCGK
jgi:Cdc6-like AAA superfamily ATPase